MNDKITLRDALENPIWLMVYLSEPGRKIDVTMSYIELKAIYDMVDAKRIPRFPDSFAKEKADGSLHQGQCEKDGTGELNDGLLE